MATLKVCVYCLKTWGSIIQYFLWCFFFFFASKGSLIEKHQHWLGTRCVPEPVVSAFMLLLLSPQHAVGPPESRWWSWGSDPVSYWLHSWPTVELGCPWCTAHSSSSAMHHHGNPVNQIATFTESDHIPSASICYFPSRDWRGSV